MAFKKHGGIFFTWIAMVFLFLSSAASATGLKISLENAPLAYSCTLQNLPGAEEESFLQTPSDEKSDADFSFRHSSPNRLFKKEINWVVFDDNQWQPKFSFISYNLLLRPAYYHFLFRHTLF